MNLQWFVLRSKPNKELSLWREVTARGYDSFFPQLRVRPVNPRSRIIRPYFPGYLFVRAEIDVVGISIFQWMPFSSGFVSFDGMAATVPDNLIQAIRRRLDEVNAVGGEQMVGLKSGDAVLIQGGPFDGYKAIFDTRLAGTERVHVFLRLLRDRHIAVELSTAQIQRLSPKMS